MDKVGKRRWKKTAKAVFFLNVFLVFFYYGFMLYLYKNVDVFEKRIGIKLESTFNYLSL